MSKYAQQSRGTQVPAATPLRGTQHPAQAPTHSQIAQRAYEIYVESNYQEGRSMQNWIQAEQELTNQPNWMQAGRNTKPRGIRATALR